MGFDQAYGEKIENVPGVKDAVPVVENRSWMASTGESLMVMGVDLLQEKAVRSYQSQGRSVVGDSLTFITHPDSMILSDALPKVTATRWVTRSNCSPRSGKMKFTVRAILSPKGLAAAYGGALAIMDIDAARRAFGKDGKTDRLDLVMAKGADLPEVAARSASSCLRLRRRAARDAIRADGAHDPVISVHVAVLQLARPDRRAVSDRQRGVHLDRRAPQGDRDAARPGHNAAGHPRAFSRESSAIGMAGALLGALLRARAGGLAGGVRLAGDVRAVQRADRCHATSSSTCGRCLAAVSIGAASSLIAALIPALKATHFAPIEAINKDIGEQWPPARALCPAGRAAGRPAGGGLGIAQHGL